MEHRRKDLVARVKIRQAGNSAQVSACAEGEHELRLCPKEMRHLFLLGVSNGTVNQARQQCAICKTLDVVSFSVEGHWPENDVDAVREGQEALRKVDNCFVAAATRRAPVKSDLRLVKHGSVPPTGHSLPSLPWVQVPVSVGRAREPSPPSRG